MDVHPLANKLKDRRFSYRDCVLAIKGEKIPSALGPLAHRLCLIRGIRYHANFGEELRGLLPEFTRSLNASRIMNDSLPPQMSSEDDMPYCIWHPKTASEETYAKLARQYPEMRYQIARACSVAGYTQLFRKLDIRPDMSIAEEARESGNGDIYELVMAHPARFRIMNDYERSIMPESDTAGHLNGDTAVRRTLDVRYPTSPSGQIIHKPTFNIAEDMNVGFIGEEQNENPPHNLALQLLHEPLPKDLPTVDKDLLIVMAAYYGDIDRYVRLRRPSMIANELQCCIRGIYHNSMFAVWAASREDRELAHPKICQAIDARFIMNNVLSRINKSGPAPPYLIWWPSQARPSTYRELARLDPRAMPQCLRASIACDYEELFHELLPLAVPDHAHHKEAMESGNPQYLQALEARLNELGTMFKTPERDWMLFTRRDLEYSSNILWKNVTERNIAAGQSMLYNGEQCNAGFIELRACRLNNQGQPRCRQFYNGGCTYGPYDEGGGLASAITSSNGFKCSFFNTKNCDLSFDVAPYLEYTPDDVEDCADIPELLPLDQEHHIGSFMCTPA
ncbi:hypothetical protein PRZ48_006744 [Zasmidium cellare]|uniref:Uncharacterized protein n=1 Tax=Zasmidium cellare TaxID=395010 RepID=A0ABR0EQC0_ZASCE|nr:hypothetical protein PRZ48_006744 [Zasmidium cellare]